MAQRGQKKIDTWTVTHDGATATIVVFLRRGENGSTATFIAECNELSLRSSNPNIDELERDIRAKAKAAMSLVFNEYYFVTFDGHARETDSILSDTYEHCGDASADSKIKVERILLTDPSPTTGRRMVKTNHGGTAREWNGKIGEGDTYNRGRYSALLPNSPEIRAGLRRLFAGYSDLNSKVRELLNVEKAERNLTLIGLPGANLLTAASEPETAAV